MLCNILPEPVILESSFQEEYFDPPSLLGEIEGGCSHSREEMGSAYQQLDHHSIKVRTKSTHIKQVSWLSSYWLVNVITAQLRFHKH